jgi:hypothetical protein
LPLRKLIQIPYNLLVILLKGPLEGMFMFENGIWSFDDAMQLGALCKDITDEAETRLVWDSFVAKKLCDCPWIALSSIWYMPAGNLPVAMSNIQETPLIAPSSNFEAGIVTQTTNLLVHEQVRVELLGSMQPHYAKVARDPAVVEATRRLHDALVEWQSLVESVESSGSETMDEIAMLHSVRRALGHARRRIH